MTRQTKEHRTSPPDDLVPPELAVPLGTPRWISPELVAETLQTWQPYYQEALTPEEAVAIIKSAGRLVDVLTREVEG